MYTLETFVSRFADTVRNEYGLTLELANPGNGEPPRVQAYDDTRWFVVGVGARSGQITPIQSRAHVGRNDPARIIRYWLAQQIADDIINGGSE